MAGLVAAVAVVGIAAAAAIGSSYLKSEGAKAAAQKQIDALKAQEGINVPALSTEAQQADEAKYKGTLALQAQVDPGLAATRQNSIDQLAALSGPQKTDAEAQGLADAAYNENVSDPQTGALRQKLLADAQAQLDAGATLSPAFQAEVVRSGLENSTGSGVSANRDGAAGRDATKVLGVAGEQLKQARVASANSEANTADNMAATRASILGNLIPVINQVPAVQMQRAQAGFSTAQNALPAYGLSGSQTVGLELQRIADKNKTNQAIAQQQAQQQLAQYGFYASTVSAVGNAATSAYGAYGAGGSGAGAAAINTSGTPQTIGSGGYT